MGQTHKLSSQGPLDTEKKQPVITAPLWVSTLATILFGLIYTLLPARITFGPSWLPLIIVIVLSLPGLVAFLLGHPLPHHINRALSFCVLGVITAFLITGVVLLISSLPTRQQGSDAINLLRTGGALWLSNVLVFGLWYWEIDGDGPHKRARAGHKAADLLFPQQADGNKQHWIPHFVDYLFVSFTGATALSPTDTYPLSHRAKLLMMIEAIIALTILSILIGRAINIV
ncbi:hypothetical protein KDA_06940 [Dictyobacter alpinus]|uniref:DUF1345 domain-containing protein n=1 Tax=Dictyobacter alpinus TaxID=2014873 RepID=A0A402B1G7_9CHLR|nr:hypothetical protein [Dictyobacter alpinus]GCE25210.1 hypothetical protein KDA_06940 [Dictyobacter alpinus]